MSRISSGTVHMLPADVRRAVSVNEETIAVWNSLTPLARNEWICWVTSVKRVETRAKHLDRLVHDLERGKRRPCCWAGCPHR